MTKSLIAGIDVGTTTGLSVLDLNKNLLFITSKKNFSESDIKRQILSFGKPVIIATDKKKVPYTINKLSASFNCKVFKPDHDLTIEEKNNIIKVSIRDDHERDSLAAAYFAFRYYEPQFRQVERILASRNMKSYENMVKEMLILKEAKNIAEAIELLKPERTEIREVTKEINLDWKEQARKRERELEEERRRNEILKLYCDKLEERMRTLERQKQSYLEEQVQKNEDVRRAILREKEIKSRDILINQLRFEISKQKELLKIYEERLKMEQEEKSIIKDRMVPVVIIPDFSKEDILNADRKFNIKNKVVFFEKTKFSTGASKALEKIMPKVIIADIEKEIVNQLKEAGIIVVDRMEIERKEFFGSISPQNIEDVIRKVEKRDFVDWLEDYRRR